MKHFGKIQMEFVMLAARWELMVPESQKRYKKKHPNSKKKVLREKMQKAQIVKKVKHHKNHKLKHMKKTNKLNYDATYN